MPTKGHRIGDAPIENKYRELMQSLAQYLDRYFNGPDLRGDLQIESRPRKTGFVLLTFDLGDTPGRCNYISNARREDIVVLLREQLKRFEGSPDVTGHA